MLYAPSSGHLSFRDGTISCYLLSLMPEVAKNKIAEFTAGPVEIFPQQFEHICDFGIIEGLVNPLFPAFFDDFNFDGLTVQWAKMSFPDTVEFEYRVFPAFAA
jgi:hypothetical protein